MDKKTELPVHLIFSASDYTNIKSKRFQELDNLVSQ